MTCLFVTSLGIELQPYDVAGVGYIANRHLQCFFAGRRTESEFRMHVVGRDARDQRR